MEFIRFIRLGQFIDDAFRARLRLSWMASRQPASPATRQPCTKYKEFFHHHASQNSPRRLLCCLRPYFAWADNSVWSKRCVFRGSPQFVETKVATTEDCASLCENTPPCGYFFRTPSRNGTCTGMTGRVKLRDADPALLLDTTCGVLKSMAFGTSGTTCVKTKDPPTATQRRIKFKTGGIDSWALNASSKAVR